MAHSNSKSNKANADNINVSGGDGEVKTTTFHDFLGNKSQAPESSPSAGGRQLPLELSAFDTSGLATERHAGDHIEGIPFNGARGEITGPKNGNRLIGNKRSNSDSFMGSSRDKILQGQADSQDSPLLSKLLRYSSGVEQSRRQMSSHFPTDSRNDANTSKWDRAIPVNLGPALKYSGQLMPFGYQAQSNRFKDTNIGPSSISKKAADEGSRTGIKEFGVLSSMNAISGRQQPSGVLIHSAKISQPGSESSGGQMTIFYGGQAHVFDSVHRNKADVIMALAGSNGGSWSTSYNPNAAVTPSTGEHRITSGKNDAMLKELRWKPLDKASGGTGMRK